jgi:hypothetical protein
VRWLWIWTLLLGLITVGVSLLPELIVRTAQKDTEPGAGLGWLGIFFLYLPFAFVAPAVLGGTWLAGYVVWRRHMKTVGESRPWPMPKTLTYLGLAVATAYVLTFTACNGVLPGFTR